MLNRRCMSVLLSAVTLYAGSSQAVELPQPSPKARVEQTVGLSLFSVDYSSPAVAGRKVWNGLVPYDAPWRSGANRVTKLTASQPFTFGDKAVPAGSYALYTIPGKDSWTVALNTESEAWGASLPDESTDAVRVTVKPEQIPFRERLIYTFSNVTYNGARLDLEWERLRVGIPLKVETLAHVASSLKDVEDPNDLAAAMQYVDRIAATSMTWDGHWLRAQLLARQGKKAQAIREGQLAQQIGSNDATYKKLYAAQVEAALAKWSK